MRAAQPAAAGFDGTPRRALDGRYTVALDAPIAAMRSPAAAAFRAVDGGARTADLVAVVGDADLPSRIDLVARLRRAEHPHLMRCVGAGLAAVEPARAYHPVVVYERPRGGSLVGESGLGAMTESDLRAGVIGPLAGALGALHAEGICHRGLRPDNLFFKSAAGGALVLGDGLIGVPGQAQPAVYEPLDTAPAPPLARGTAGPPADYFALGVTVLTLLTGRAPGDGLDDETLLWRRLNDGSHAALVGERRFSARLDALLDGLLADSARWGEAELDDWLKDYRVQPNLFLRPERAAKPLRFAGRACWTRRALAEAFNADTAEARLELGSERLETWLANELDEPGLATTLKARRDSFLAGRRHGGYGPDELVARACIDLDPEGPIRYRGTAVTLDGVGPMLAAATVGKHDAEVETLVAMLAHGLFNAWIEAQAERRRRLAHKTAQLIQLQRYLKIGGLGFGLERCLYALNPGMRCLTPALEARYTHDSASLLWALEKHPGKGLDLIDEHVAAFLAVAHHPKVERRLAETPQPERPAVMRAVALIAILAVAQRESRAPPLPGLAARLRAPLASLIEVLHGHSLRQRRTAELDRLAAAGRLGPLLDFICDRAPRAEDRHAFHLARARYARAGGQIRRVRRSTGKRMRQARAIGFRLAARIAYLGLGITAAVVALRHAV